MSDNPSYGVYSLNGVIQKLRDEVYDPHNVQLFKGYTVADIIRDLDDVLVDIEIDIYEWENSEQDRRSQAAVAAAISHNRWGSRAEAKR